MKSLYIMLLCLSVSVANAQSLLCGTPLSKKVPNFTEKQIDSLNKIKAVNVPYALKIWITVFADDNGSNQAATDADVILKMQQMQARFQPHSICFILGGITHVNSTDLNNQDADTEMNELYPYMQIGWLNVFIHKTLPGLFGTAYSIPNSFLSLRFDVFENTSNNTTFDHELGHCLGLIHTFENATGEENVARAGTCTNCSSSGDLLCDTPADNGGPTDAACVYTGTDLDACGVAYAPNTNNIMSYFYSCSNTFTAGQGNRMRNFLLGNFTLNALLAQDTQNFPSTANAGIYNASGTQVFVARDFVGISQFSNNIFETTGSAKQVIIGKTVSLKAGTRIHPTTGRVHLKANPFCQ